MNVTHVPTPAGQRLLAGLLVLAAAAFAATGLVAMFALSPKVLYADPWRFTAHFLTTPWPWNVLDADNGHREVLPNLVRVIELRWLEGNQWLQIVVGAALACATVATLAMAIRRQSAPPLAKAAALFFAAAGIFWLGNERGLTHGNESVHVYLVTLCLVIGSWILSDPAADRSPGRLASAVGLGWLATFSFGSGIACFAGYAAVLVLRRAPFRSLAIVAAAAAAVALLHLVLGNSGVGSSLHWSPSRQIPDMSRWLAAPFVYAGWPLLDPKVAAAIPVAIVRDPFLAVAQAFEQAFGNVMLARWPNALAGLAGLVWLVFASLASYRRPHSMRGDLLGLAMAWFALAAGILIAISRADYFVHHPDQVVAPRYLPWSVLFWAGLAISALLRSEPRKLPRRAMAALLVGVLLAPSQIWMAKLALHTQSTAELTVVGTSVGVLDPQLPLGETVFAEMSAALPLLRRERTAMFAWPETRAMGESLPADAQAVTVENLRLAPVTNRLGSPGYAVTFELEASACPRLVLVGGEAGEVAGMAVRRGWSPYWQGWARQAAGPRTGVFAICESRIVLPEPATQEK